MKIYTKTGDDGTTALFGGKRVPKHALRIDAYGTVDELNSALGALIVSIEDADLQDKLRNMQSRLFDVGSHLAAVPGKKLNLPKVSNNLVQDLEDEMDRMNETLPALRHFVLPGNCESNARAHICRTVCRRAERLVVALSESEEVDHVLVIYLNRLSDYFFVLSRWLGHQKGHEEVKWVPDLETKK